MHIICGNDNFNFTTTTTSTPSTSTMPSTAIQTSTTTTKSLMSTTTTIQDQNSSDNSSKPTMVLMYVLVGAAVLILAIVVVIGVACKILCARQPSMLNNNTTADDVTNAPNSGDDIYCTLEGSEPYCNIETNTPENEHGYTPITHSQNTPEYPETDRNEAGMNDGQYLTIIANPTQNDDYEEAKTMVVTHEYEHNE